MPNTFRRRKAATPTQAASQSPASLPQRLGGLVADLMRKRRRADNPAAGWRRGGLDRASVDAVQAAMSNLERPR